MGGYARFRYVKLGCRIFDVYCGLLDIILDTVKQRALIDDKGAQVPEEFCQLPDGTSYFRDFTIALCKINVGQLLLRLDRMGGLCLFTYLLEKRKEKKRE